MSALSAPPPASAGSPPDGPVPGWAELDDRDHIVQFYDTDAFFLDSLAAYARAGLAGGEAVVVIATPEHREGLGERLRAGGLDPDALDASGRYLALDAAKTLASFMVDGAPDRDRFSGTVAGLLEAGAGRPVRIFGEMVGLLLAEGKLDAMVALEALWDDLHASHGFRLYCAYPIRDFSGEGRAASFEAVCGHHTRVLPAESFEGIREPEERRRAIARLQQRAVSLGAEVRERAVVERALREALEERRLSLLREQAARVEAENANRLKDEFLATISHELRTPLNAIVGWAHILKMGALDAATVARGLDIIERNARAQARLVDDMLDVSRVITGTLRLRTGVVDPATVITGAIDAVRLAAEAKGVRLEVVLDAAAGRVVGDAGRLQQVVWNLVANAIKFTPAGGGVAVRLGRAGGAVEISVRDSGEGIDPEFLPFLFDRFRQADSTISRRHGGLGLGLAIVRHLVELHGGEVRAESAGAGAGATFTVRLPVADPIPSPREGEAAAPGVALAGLDVLVVAGDPVSLDMLVVVLGGAGAVVRAATTAAEARDALRGRKPDALLCDLPPEAGHAVMDALRAFEADTGTWVPALALTGSAPAEDPSRARAAGFNLFVQKPMDPGELVLAIATLARPGDGAGEPSRGG